LLPFLISLLLVLVWVCHTLQHDEELQVQHLGQALNYLHFRFPLTSATPVVPASAAPTSTEGVSTGNPTGPVDVSTAGADAATGSEECLTTDETEELDVQDVTAL